MSEYSIRMADFSDISAILAVEKSASQKFSGLPYAFLMRLPENPPINDKQFYQSLIQDNPCFVLIHKQQLIGFLVTEILAAQSIMHLWELDVDHAYQGNGLGKKLLSYAVKYAKKSHLHKITLTTFKEVPWNAPFYQKLGFLEIPNPDNRLACLIDKEVKLGFPRDTRCAMQLVL